MALIMYTAVYCICYSKLGKRLPIFIGMTIELQLFSIFFVVWLLLCSMYLKKQFLQIKWHNQIRFPYYCAVLGTLQQQP